MADQLTRDPMRFTGRITTWNAERGFGFVTPTEGGQEVFVHVSELPRGFTPAPDVLVSFELALNPQGKKKAVRLQLPGAQATRDTQRRTAQAAGPHRPAPAPDSRRRPGPPSALRSGLQGLVTLLLVATLGWAAYDRYVQPRHGASFAVPAGAVAATQGARPLPAAGTVYRCDGRLHCSQMTSCAEATWFLQNCPGAQMDGNGDGVPCEQQWCR